MLQLFSVNGLMHLKNIVKFCIVFGAAQFENVIGVVNLPPSARTFQPHVADKFVGTLNSSAAQRVTSSTQFTVANAGLVGFEVSREFGTGLFRLGVAAF